jgi:hypothetical protein
MEKSDEILDLLKKMNRKIDMIAARVSSLEITGSMKKPSSSSSSGLAPSDVVFAQNAASQGKVEVDGRMVCPKCGAFGKNIGEKEDRSKAISYSGGMAIYAKNYYCKQCSFEWK